MQSVLEIALKRANQTEEFHLMSSPREVDAVANDSEQRVDEAEGLAEAGFDFPISDLSCEHTSCGRPLYCSGLAEKGQVDISDEIPTSW